MAGLDERLDALYQLPPGAFTAARTALAKTLAGAEKCTAAALKKPTVVPWAVNQVYWKARPLFTRVVERGDALRTAERAALQGKKADVRAASAAHRQAVTEAVRRAVQLAGHVGFKPNAEHLMRMFEALSLAPAPPAEPAGSFTTELAPAGFEATAKRAREKAEMAVKQAEEAVGSAGRR